MPLTSAERALYLDTHAKAAGLWHNVRGMPPACECRAPIFWRTCIGSCALCFWHPPSPVLVSPPSPNHAPPTPTPTPDPPDINKRLLQIMSLLNPLRRICSGGRLTAGDLGLPEHLEAEMAPLTGVMGAAALLGGAAVREDETLQLPDSSAECPVCLDAFESPVVTPCGHWFCRECCLGVLATNRHCPLCRRDVAESQLRAPSAAAVAAAAAKAGVGAAAGDAGASGSGGGGGGDGGSGIEDGPVACESKLRALLRELRAMRRRDPSSKAVSGCWLRRWFG